MPYDRSGVTFLPHLLYSAGALGSMSVASTGAKLTLPALGFSGRVARLVYAIGTALSGATGTLAIKVGTTTLVTFSLPNGSQNAVVSAAPTVVSNLGWFGPTDQLIFDVTGAAGAGAIWTSLGLALDQV